MKIEAATPQDRGALEALLRAAGLPVDGFEAHLASARVAWLGGRIIGCAALELYDEDALLRSVAVAAEERGAGLGPALVREMLSFARQSGVARVWLLTTTAERFFARLGFTRVDRKNLPASLGASAELRGACPASAVAMGIDLEG